MLNGKIQKFLYLPTVAAGTISLLLCILLFEQSENPSIYIFSLPRFLAVVSLGCIAAYFTLSVFSRRIVFFNNVLIINVVFIALGVEIVLRLFVGDLPPSIVKLLPIQVRNQKLAELGLMTNETIRGEGLIYSYTPNLKIKKLPWVSIDQDGYRNSKIYPNPDIILLGDASTFAHQAKQDLGDISRKEGFTTRNLGFGGYSVGHYRDVYKKFIVDRKVSHKLVIINLCLCNDISGSRSHFMHFKRGLTWKEYLGLAPRIKGMENLKFSWALTVAFNGAYEVRERYIMSSRGKNVATTLYLEKGKVTVPYRNTKNTFPLNDPAWEITEKYLKDISRYAAKEGAKVILAVYPSLMGIYAPWFSDNNRQNEIHSQQVKNINDMSNRLGFIFVDYSPPLQKAVSTKDILIKHDDYQTNDVGVQVMWETLRPIIRKVIG